MGLATDGGAYGSAVRPPQIAAKSRLLLTRARGHLLLTDNQNCCTGFFEAVSLQTACKTSSDCCLSVTDEFVFHAN
jgi:hypothetical protein